MKYKSLFYLTIACCACTCILAFPYASTRGISKGIELCLSVIIPSLYPFTVCSMVIFEYIVHINVKHNSAIKFISGLDAELFIIYFKNIFSFCTFEMLSCPWAPLTNCDEQFYKLCNSLPKTFTFSFRIIILVVDFVKTIFVVPCKILYRERLTWRGSV